MGWWPEEVCGYRPLWRRAVAAAGRGEAYANAEERAVSIRLAYRLFRSFFASQTVTMSIHVNSIRGVNKIWVGGTAKTA